MSTKTRSRADAKLRRSAPLFAALGDENRLSLLARLSDGSPLTITQLAEGAPITRQAVTKHLHVLQESGLVRGERQGREQLFQLQPEALREARDSLDGISKQWDVALRRLKSFVEE
jgi:DNA-binding transcriptional ArsR family regulator